MSAPDLIATARQVVDAKLRYWNALGELEKATAGACGWSDAVNNAVDDRIADLAAGSVSPDAAQDLDDESLGQLVQLAGGKP